MDIDALLNKSRQMSTLSSELAQPQQPEESVKPVDYKRENDNDHTDERVPFSNGNPSLYGTPRPITSHKYGLYFMMAGAVVYAYSDNEPMWLAGAGILFSGGLYESLVSVNSH